MAKKMGRNGKEEYDESSEANLINRWAKFAIQPPGEGDQIDDRRATRVTKVRFVKRSGEREDERKERGRYWIRHSHAPQTDCRRCS